MKRLVGAISAILILLLLCSGAFANIVNFFLWLFTLQYSQPETSFAGGIVVRILTFVVSYSLVGLIFNALGWFNSKIMSVAYFIISALLGFAIAYLVWSIEQYILIIGIVLGVIAVAAVTAFVVFLVVGNKKSKEKGKDEE